MEFLLLPFIEGFCLLPLIQETWYWVRAPQQLTHKELTKEWERHQL